MFYKNLKGIYLFAMQIDKCQEKVWQKGEQNILFGFLPLRNIMKPDEVFGGDASKDAAAF